MAVSPNVGALPFHVFHGATGLVEQVGEHDRHQEGHNVEEGRQHHQTGVCALPPVRFVVFILFVVNSGSMPSSANPAVTDTCRHGSFRSRQT